SFGFGHVLLFGVNETPNLVALNAFARDAAHCLVMKASADWTCLRQQLGDGVDRHVPATRLIERIEEPSQSIERIWTRLARGSLFMPLYLNLYGFRPACLFTCQ